jgi:hypothetical protein
VEDDEPTTFNHDTKIQQEIEFLQKILASQFQEQQNRQLHFDSLQATLQRIIKKGTPSNTYHVLSKELSQLISDSAWNDKALVNTKQKLNQLRKRQSFTKVERAFVAISEDPNYRNVTESFINPSSSCDDQCTTGAQSSG